MIGNEQKIRELAYFLWLERGAPIGNPDEDWIKAENTFSKNIFQQVNTSSLYPKTSTLRYGLKEID